MLCTLVANYCVTLVAKNYALLIAKNSALLLTDYNSRIGVITDGQMKGDTLFAMYTSMQEGDESECEIAFLKKGDSYILTNDIFLESNYQYNSDYSKGSFKDKNSIKFDGDTLKLVANK